MGLWRPVGAPQMAPRDGDRGAVLHRRPHAGDHECHHDIGPQPVGCLILMIDVEVLVVSVESLCFGPGTDVEGHGDGADCLACVGVLGFAVEIGCRLVHEFGT